MVLFISTKFFDLISLTLSCLKKNHLNLVVHCELAVGMRDVQIVGRTVRIRNSYINICEFHNVVKTLEALLNIYVT